MSALYLLHFIDPQTGAPFRLADHAGHYLGFVERGIESRIAFHRAGRGSPLVRAVCVDRGMDFVVALELVGGTRSLERALKNRKRILCPICRGDARIRRSRRGARFVQFRPGRRSRYAWIA